MEIAKHFLIFRLFGATAPQWARASSFTRFLDHIHRRTKVGRTPLDEWSARRRDLYLTTHNTHNRQTSMPPVGFEPTISAGERPRTYALKHRAAIGTGILWLRRMNKNTDNHIRTKFIVYVQHVSASKRVRIFCTYRKGNFYHKCNRSTATRVTSMHIIIRDPSLRFKWYPRSFEISHSVEW